LTGGRERRVLTRSIIVCPTFLMVTVVSVCTVAKICQDLRPASPQGIGRRRKNSVGLQKSNKNLFQGKIEFSSAKF
jgi:hypothetical protein